jgi:hypothetical protein
MTHVDPIHGLLTGEAVEEHEKRQQRDRLADTEAAVERLSLSVRSLEQGNLQLARELEELRGNMRAMAKYARQSREIQKILVSAIDPSAVPEDEPVLRLVPQQPASGEGSGA